MKKEQLDNIITDLFILGSSYHKGGIKHLEFIQEDEAQEEVREKNKSNKHIGRDDES